MTKKGLILFGLIALVFVVGCNEAGNAAGEGTSEDSLVTLPIKVSDEHYVSPLAQLMRDMTAFADSTRQRLLRGDELPPYPEDFKNMLSAEPTPGMVDHRTFDPFAFSYLHQLDSLYKVIPSERQQAFDELVLYCAACHGQVCPGPLMRINKLRLPQSPG